MDSLVLGTFGTRSTIRAVLRYIQTATGRPVTRFVWEYPPLPLLHRFEVLLEANSASGRADAYDSAVEAAAAALAARYTEVKKTEMQPPAFLPFTLHGSYTPLCSSAGCLSEDNDYGRNLTVARIARRLSALLGNEAPLIAVNYHAPKTEVGVDRLAGAVKAAARAAGSRVVVTVEPQYTEHSMSMKEVAEAVEMAGERNAMLSLQLENEIIREFWTAISSGRYSSFRELEMSIDAENYWYSKLVELYEHNARTAGTEYGVVPMFVRYSKVEPYRAFGSALVWKRRVFIDADCTWCGPHFSYIYKALVKFLSEDRSPPPMLLFVYTGTDDRMPYLAAAVRRARDLLAMFSEPEKY